MPIIFLINVTNFSTDDFRIFLKYILSNFYLTAIEDPTESKIKYISLKLIR